MQVSIDLCSRVNCNREKGIWQTILKLPEASCTRKKNSEGQIGAQFGMCWAPIDIDMCKSWCYRNRDRNKTLHEAPERSKSWNKISSPTGGTLISNHYQDLHKLYYIFIRSPWDQSWFLHMIWNVWLAHISVGNEDALNTELSSRATTKLEKVSSTSAQ